MTAKTLVDMNAGDIIEMPDQKENYTFANAVKIGQIITFTTHQKQSISKDMILNRTRNESLIQEIKEKIIDKKIKEKINGKLILSTTNSARLELSHKDKEVIVYGAKAEEAKNQPMDSARIEKQMRKTGNTEFEFENLSIELDGNLFIPMQQLNELRREGLEALEKVVLDDYRRDNALSKSDEEAVVDVKNKNCKISVYVEEKEQFETVLLSKFVDRIYLDSNAMQQVWLGFWKIRESIITIIMYELFYCSR